ncbi:hypothetical protein LMG26858_06200 [Achromobacter anxifer]|uniref:Uncharacterized protein n=1 Tax=Achromobacter anxifer TaxID=1287737 RepID=A0A6S7F3B8_9BURK|nr:hypothetical protein LMG26858_06200 [Achromobacter anxifer]
MEQRRHAHAGQGVVAAELEAAAQHALRHDAARIPFHGRQGLRQDLAGVAARPIGGLHAQRGIGMARRRGDGARLHDPEAPPVPYPFDVIPRAGVVQRAGGVARDVTQGFGLRVAQHGLRGLFRRRVGQARTRAIGGQAGVALGADAPLQQRPGLPQIIFAQAVLVALGLAADQRFAQAPVGVDQHLVMAARHGIDGEGDARCDGIDQRHDDHGHARGLHAQLLAIGTRLRRPLRIPDLPERLDGRIGAAHVEAGKMDAGERRARGVLLRRGRAQGQRPLLPAARGQFAAQGPGHGGRHLLARFPLQAELGGQHETVGHGHAQLRHAAQLPTLAARGLGPGKRRRGPVQQGGSHAGAPGVTPCTKRLMAASNSAFRLARGRSSQRSIAPRYRN